MNIPKLLTDSFAAAARWLKVRRDLVNNLNIFPVPDGDTGTNMLNTVNAAAAAVANNELPLPDLCDVIVEQSLWGARGNSGVIMANFFKGFFRELRTIEAPPGYAFLSDCLQAGRREAYHSTVDPVEGTILSVISAVTAKTEELSDPSLTLIEYIREIYSVALTALEKTPEQLEILKTAGVVDAGGCGFFYIIEAILRSLEGKALDESARGEGYIPDTGTDSAVWEAEPDARFCLEITLKTSGNTKAIIDSLQAFGNSEVAIDTGDLMKVHLHTDDPQPVIAKAREFAEVLDVHQENMINQQFRMLADRKYSYDGYPGVAAVVTGSGMQEIFRELGTDAIIDGGSTMNPSVKEIVWACDSLRKKNIILLPNNRDTFLTAREAARLAHCDVSVLETASMVEGIASLMNFSPASSPEDNLNTMHEGIAAVAWGYITRAERETPEARKGDYFAGRGKQIFAGGSLKAAAESLLKDCQQTHHSLISVYTGIETTEDESTSLKEVLTGVDPGLEVEFMYGGQPHYLFLLSME